MTCYGCGRLLGLRTPIECPCWRSVNEGAVIPKGIAAIRVRVLNILKAADKATSEEQRASVRAAAQLMNRYLREKVMLHGAQAVLS